MSGIAKLCPKCKQMYFGYSAISRIDNTMLICTDCGRKEALDAFKAYKEEIDAKIKEQESK